MLWDRDAYVAGFGANVHLSLLRLLYRNTPLAMLYLTGMEFRHCWSGGFVQPPKIRASASHQKLIHDSEVSHGIFRLDQSKQDMRCLTKCWGSLKL